MTKASELNKSHYERVWGKRELLDHRLWSTWPLIKSLSAKKALEVGCGNKPRIPVAGNSFLDINSKAVEKLNQTGGIARTFDLARNFPFKDGEFELVCSFEVLEHLKNDERILAELSRVLSKKGTAVISFPLNMKFWVEYDRRVGHVRRYEPGDVERFFGRAGFAVVDYAPIKVTWPNKWQSTVLSSIVNLFPGLASSVQNRLELTANSPLRKKLNLTSWGKGSVKSLAHETTALFVLKKK